MTLLALASAALFVRLLHIRLLSAEPIFQVLLGDSQRYLDWAADIVAGDWAGGEVFYQAPFYPYVLAGIGSVYGLSADTVRTVQAVFGTTACVLMALGTARLFGWTAGILAGALLAVYPPAIFFDGLVQKSSLDLLLMSLVVLAVSSYIDSSRLRWVVVLGIAYGCLVLNRENTRILFPVLLFWLADASPPPGVRRFVPPVVFATIAALAVMPVALRNYAVGGEWLISTSQLGPNFYIGNHTGASGIYDPLVPGRGNVKYEREDAERLASEALQRDDLSPSQVSRYWLHAALGDIAREPAAWLRLLAWKARLSVNTVEVMDTESIAFHASYSGVLQGFGVITFGVLITMSMWGALISFHDWRRLWVFYAMTAALLGSVILFFVLARYRYPVVPLVLPFAAVGVVRLRQAWVEERRRALAMGALCLIVAMAVNVPIRASSDETAANYGTELLRLGRPTEAVPLLKVAADMRPEDPSAQRDLAIAYARSGLGRRAVGVFSRIVTLAPEDVENHRELVVACLEAGFVNEAVEAGRAGVERHQDSARLHDILATALWAAGDEEAAVVEYRTAIGLAPDDEGILSNAGAALLQVGEVQDAKSVLERAIAQNPELAEARGNLALVLERLGDISGAERQLREAVRTRPDHGRLWASLADLFVRMGRSSAAEDVLREALGSEALPPRARLETLVRLASLYSQRGRGSESLGVLAQAAELARGLEDSETERAILTAIRSLQSGGRY